VDAEKKQEEQFRIWGAGEGIPFQDAGAKAAYQERVGLIKDAIQLRQSRNGIPICPSAGFFPMQYAASRCMTPCMITELSKGLDGLPS
jgi:hypothetical protein